MKYANIGGQAVMEGVMMRHKDRYAVAVRKENHEIEVKSDTHISYGKRFHVSGIPIIRGAFAFVDSLVLGMQTLTWSASFFEEEEPADAAGRKKEAAAVSGKKEEEPAADSDKGFMVLTVILSLALSIGLFMVLPFFISNIFRRATDSGLLLGIIEGLVRLMIFVAYIVLISRMKDIQRLFMYHGAEHKTINCCLLYTSRLDLGTNTPPQTTQRFKSLSRKISASSVPSSGKTAQRNHLQQTEKETVCGQVQVSPSSRTMQLPSSQQQHSWRIRLAACFLCAGVMR